MEVILKNEINAYQGGKNGTYKEHQIVNGKKSWVAWKSMGYGNTIRFDPMCNCWIIATLGNFGSKW